MLNIKKTEFLREIEKGRIPPLYKEIPYFEPYKVYEVYTENYLHSKKNTVLLESSKGNFKIARYSFIGFDPFMIFRLKDQKVLLYRTDNNPTTFDSHKPLRILKDFILSYPQKVDMQIPPFQGGAIGAFSYDFVRYIEKIPKTGIDDLKTPDAHFLIISTLISFDHYEKKAWVVFSPAAREILGKGVNFNSIDWAKIYDEADEKLYEISQVIYSNLSQLSKFYENFNNRTNNTEIIYEMSKKQYMDIVRRAKEYIAAGDIFQANLSQRISTNIGNKETWHIYKTLRKINPSPFAVYADFGDYHVVSSSPERLIRVLGGTIDTRPIAGTRPRGVNTTEDEAMRKELLLNEKERAEHIMLIDLERNDIGRVSKYGTVIVDELMITEDYSHVIHIVSNIRGILQEGKTCLDVLRATFPGGTITGVPKVRCMEIIDELEPVLRGLYTGSFGYISFGGNMDMNIIIRTMIIKDGFAYVQAGAGIVADSDPEREYYETLKKAEALIKTLTLV